MQGKTKFGIGLGAAAMVAAGLSIGGAAPAHAQARDIARLQPATLTFNQSVLRRTTFEIYRDPFDELQTRPYNMLFSNIGRHPNLTPWEGQEGQYSKYVNALIGNNGRSNVDNGADAMQGAFIGRAGVNRAFGVSAAFLSGTDGSDDTNAVSAFSDTDDVSGYDVRFATAWKLSERDVLGVGARFVGALSEVTSSSFDFGVGGNVTVDTFEQTGVLFDVGLRRFVSPTKSWEVQAVLGVSGFDQLESSDGIHSSGVITSRLVSRNYHVTDTNIAITGGYNWQPATRLGETAVRAGYERLQRELDNNDLAYMNNGGVITPMTALVASDPIIDDRLFVSIKSVFPAGETEMFTGAEIAFGSVTGATQVNASGTLATETIDDSELGLGLTLGVRQNLYRDKLRLIVSGRADLIDFDEQTTFQTGTDGESGTQTLTNYSIALEGVLSNVTFDLAWLSVEEEAVVPVDLGVPTGSRRAVRVDRLVVSAAVSW